jgi:D-arabinose 1-dehydrogenase-like Zn-dependent alcohol dehydrogenase
MDEGESPLMKAAVLHALGQPPRFEEFPNPVPASGEVIVREGIVRWREF